MDLLIIKNGLLLSERLSKKVQCNETKTVYKSVREAEMRAGISNVSISLCARGKSRYAGKCTITGILFTWSYV
ncbi:MAG: hypothetical protein ACTFAL_13570 [Candidatus Electronema sp. V4]|uniref:hypothetical protein n=1 Tax=Candidatus Electronema sp. V4 TaxID=3454756 RepID=UPI0040555494